MYKNNQTLSAATVGNQEHLDSGSPALLLLERGTWLEQLLLVLEIDLSKEEDYEKGDC